MPGAKASLAPAPADRFRLPRNHRGVLDQEQRELVLDHVRALLSVPTAPYAEDGQVAVVREFVAARPELRLRVDSHQNLFVTYAGHGRASRKKRKNAKAPERPTLAFSAHLDHPGFLYRGKSKGGHVATFHGGVPPAFFPSAPVRFFDVETGESLATARVAKAAFAPRTRLLTAELTQFRGRARRGMFGMWDLTPGELRGKRFRARVCDDLLGAAAILATFDLLREMRHPDPVVGIFTRAEETGFIGCQALLRSRSLRGELAVIGLECSPKRTTAKVGRGPVIRVGDRVTIFEPSLTHHLQDAAATLQAKHPEFLFQRALMDGGRCESSAYNLWSVPAGGLCLALGNYHNCGPNKTIAPEFVDWDDHEGMVALMVEACVNWKMGPADERMRKSLDLVWEREQERLTSSAARIARRTGSKK